MPIRFFKSQSQLVDVSPQAPLPVAVQSAPASSETLLVSVISVGTAAKDLLDSTNAESPTLDRCSHFRQILWMGRKSGGADLNYLILGRATDLSGNPLGDGWYEIATGTLTGSANSWFRVVLSEAQTGWDQYRIVVTSGSTQTVFSKILGR
ncbi:MAG: hypothetical protein SNJ72_07220 [Fimbriimonadales bacterium]